MLSPEKDSLAEKVIEGSLAKKQENDNKILKLKKQNTNLTYMSSGVAFLGGVGGVVYASKTGKSNWGKVGFFLVGTIVIGVIVRMFTVPKMINNNEEIKKLQSENPNVNAIVGGLSSALDSFNKENNK